MTERPLRILHLTVGDQSGGLPRYLLDLCTAMHRDGHDVTIAGDVGPLQAEFDAAPFPYLRIPLAGGPVSFVKSISHLRRYLVDHPVDLFHSHYRRATLLARRLQQTNREPLLYTVHLSHMPVSGWRRRFSDFGDHTHVAAEEAKQWVIESAGVPAERVTLIHHGVDPSRFPQRNGEARTEARQALGLPADALVGVYVGRFDDPKNVMWLIDLVAQVPALHLLLVGAGPHEVPIQKRIDEQHFADRVHLLGYRSPLQAYQASDALLLPSSQEGFSLVCCEAMSVGVPVLRTQTSGTAAMIVEGETGRSTPIDREAFLAEAISFLQNPAELNRMGIAAARRVRESLTFDRQLDETVALYRKLVVEAQKPVPVRGEAVDGVVVPST